MKTQEEMLEYFRSMPAKKKESNRYWRFTMEPARICSIRTGICSSDFPKGTQCMEAFDLTTSVPTLKRVRDFFRRFYESFHSEAQVLCVTPEDGRKLNKTGIPVLTEGMIGPFEVWVMVLPQDNHMGTSVIGENFWQTFIVGAGIRPVLRIHSHHVLEPYQSAIDYSTLNSGTLEMVLGKIFEDKLYLCYWLDVPGTDTKAQTFLAQEKPFGGFMLVSRRFNGPGTDSVRPKKRTTEYW